MAGKRVEFLGLPLDVGLTVDDVCRSVHAKGTCRISAKINPGAWAVARRNPDYLRALRAMDMVLADGEGVAWACRTLLGEPCRRMSFDMTSLADPVFRTAAEAGATVMLVGGAPGVAAGARDKLLTRYPGLKVVGADDGYGDPGTKIARILETAPDLVIAGMGVPRQELFFIALRDAGYKGCAMTCGGFFDQYLVAEDYYPRWIDRRNLRFLYRLVREPRRLWRRYLVDYRIFIGEFFRALFRKLCGRPV